MERSFGAVLDFLRALWAVDHGLFAATKVQRQRLGITGPQRLVLRIVTARPRISPGELALVLHLHPSTVSGLVKQLSDRALLLREIDSRDARRAVLTTTRKGRALGLIPGPAEELIQGALADLDRARVATAEAVLRSVARALIAPPELRAARNPARRRR